jgi:hypothetical protein
MHGMVMELGVDRRVVEGGKAITVLLVVVERREGGQGRELALPASLACHWQFGIANCHDGAGLGLGHACMGLSPQRLKQKALRPNLLWSARKSFRYLFLSQQGPATAMAVSSPFTHSTSRALLSLVLYCQGRLERRYASILIGKTLPWGDCCSAESSLWFGLHASIKRL